MTDPLAREEQDARRALKAIQRERRQQLARDAIAKIALRDELVIPARPTLTPQARARVHAAHDGRCYVCAAAVPVQGPTVAFDHVIPRALGGSDAEANLAPICTVPCHAQKTARDLSAIAKAKRLALAHTGQKKAKGRIPSRPFDAYRPLPRRGEVVRREP